MNEEIKNLINELKEVVMELHRNAGHLDDNITSLEYLLSEEDDKDSVRFLIQSYRRTRAMYDHSHQYSELIDKENDIWQRLLKATK